MILPGEIHKTKERPDSKKPISVHRAFIYGASAPGLGEIYAGSRIRGFITASLFIFFLVWFNWTFIDIMVSTMNLFFDSINQARPFALPDLPFFSFGISCLGIYYIWSWAMISSVDVAIKHQKKTGEPPQESVPWGVAISWFCPGAGQIYTGSRQFGYILFAGYLLGILLILPAYIHLYQSISLMVKSGQLSTDNPYALINIIKEQMIKLNFSFGNLFQETARYFAIAGTIASLAYHSSGADNKWTKPSAAYGIALFAMGWLCPGTGQLLQKRNKAGWYFLGCYVSSMLIIGLLLGSGFIAPKSANTLSWISILLQWSAMIEAPFHMRQYI